MAVRHRVLAALSFVVLLGASCGDRADVAETPAPIETPVPTATATPFPTPTPTPTPLDAEATLKRSGQVMQGLKSFRFSLKHKGGGTALMPGLVIEEATGQVINPDSISVSFTGTFGKGYAVRSSLITLGDASYMTNPLTGAWQAMETGVSPLGFFSPAGGISAMMLRLDNVRPLDGGVQRGRYRLAGDLPAEALAPLLGATLEGVTVQVELTIDSEELYLLSARVMGRAVESDTDEIVRVVDVSAFNEPITIEAPESP